MDREKERFFMKRYWPLVAIILVSFCVALVLLHANNDKKVMTVMVNFSGMFFLFLATLKFWDLKGFSEGFRKYDLLAKRNTAYSYIYPFLEFSIALCYLGQFIVPFVAIFTAILTFFGLIGVLQAIRNNSDLKCACMGTKLDLPLSVVSVVENVGMGVMAVFIAIAFF
ncbi:MAG: hypothetical protein S4CHLAM7_13100 [Chlamydiae bacterium]|nr:hypothetical protein [Chlamydiota bacterium]